MSDPPFLDLDPSPDPGRAQAMLLPLPFDETACYGKGTSGAPPAIWQASTQAGFWPMSRRWAHRVQASATP